MRNQHKENVDIDDDSSKRQAEAIEATEILLNELSDKIQESKVQLHKRIRARNILNDIDKRSAKDFKQFIKASNKRFGNVKCGKSLDKELKKATLTYEQIADVICSKQLYFEKDINNEKEMLKTNIESKNHEEILLIFKGLREGRERNIIRHEYDNVEKKKLELQKNSRLGNQGLNLKTSFMKNIINKSITLNKNIIKSESQKNMVKAQAYIKDMLDGERKKLNGTITNYLMHNKQQQQQNNNAETQRNEDNIEGIKDLDAQRCLFLTNKLNALYFNPKTRGHRTKSHKTTHDFNIRKLMKYTTKHSNNHNSSNRSNKSDNNLHNQSKEDFFYNSMQEIKESIANIKSRNKHINFSNTIDMVKNEIVLEQDMRTTFKNRSTAFEKFMQDPNLPPVAEYSKVIKAARIKLNNNKLLNRNKTMHNQQILSNQNKFTTSMNEIFQRKYHNWQTEAQMKQCTIDAMKKDACKNREYIKKINHVERSPLKYNDAYSLRDGTVIQCNKDINVILGNNVISKEQKEEEIIKYYMQFQADEEKNRNEEKKQWREYVENNKQLMKSNRTTCKFQSKDYDDDDDNDDDNEGNKGKMSATYFKNIPDQLPSSFNSNMKESYYKEYLQFKDAVQNKHDKYIKQMNN